MTSEPQYDYVMTCIDDSPKQVNQSLSKNADAGWELVSGGATGWAEPGPPGAMGMTQDWHVRYVMYWRRLRS
jgi:hypothetical protein